MVCEILGCGTHLKGTVERSRPCRGAHTRERGRIDKKSTGDPPTLELLSGEKFNYISIKIHNCSSHALRPALPSAYYASLCGYNDEILPYMQYWNLSGVKVTKNVRILLHASLQHDVVTYS